MDEQLLTDQVSYYRARAGEYDEWFLRQGRYDRGPQHRAAWFGEIAIVEAALAETVHGDEVLDLRVGVGQRDGQGGFLLSAVAVHVDGFEDAFGEVFLTSAPAASE